jgi:1-acyl-sn-glycerol-3-phosphate acyltransferase
MGFSHKFLMAIGRGLTSLICRIDDSQLPRVPMTGPLIIVTNHVNILEIPILYTRLQPRKMHGLVLSTHWKSPLLRWIFAVTETIPLARGEPNPQAVRRALDYLKAGAILIISPEGTRSGHGRLQQAYPGAVLLAARSQAPLLPVAYYGAEDYKHNLARLRRSDFHLAVGSPFYLDSHAQPIDRQVRQQMTDEIMYQLAALLPPAYRGLYADLSKATQDYITFPGDREKFSPQRSKEHKEEDRK